ncbi:unnamed protein product [Ophioblennius macclurei]
MTRFDLVPVDGGEPVQVPPGETVLGRGPFLRVSDRRVSRNHGLLENVDGQLRLKPTHLNPCFIQSSLSDEPQPLKRDQWHLLHHGDLFSLLPGQLIFRVEAEDEDPPTPKNSQIFEEQKEKVAPPLAAGGELEQSPPAACTSEEAPSSPSICPKQADSQEKAALEGRKKEVIAPPTEPRKRVLPDWMMAAVAGSSKKPALALKVQKPKATRSAATTSTATTSTVTTSTATRKPAQATPTRTSTSREEAQPSVKERPKKKSINQEEDPPPTKSESPSHRSATGSLPSEDEDDSAVMPAVSVPAKAQTNGSLQTSNIGNTYRNNPNPVSSTSAAPATVRTPCPYGKECYRKNPLHFQECSHPGDADYKEEEEEEDEELPECPYGTDCYRKNPLHRKEYKHTRRPGAPPTRKATKISYEDDDEEEDDDDEYEDSFIDDESLDGGDDSDYVPPPESDESVREDSQRLREEAQDLRQEAQNFLKRSK